MVRLVNIVLFLLLFVSCGGESSDFKEYYPDGTLKMRGELTNSIKTGEWFEYLPNGQLDLIKEYVNDTLILKKTFIDGRLQQTAQMLNDIKSGWLKTYYSSNGKLETVSFWENGVRKGKVQDYYESGIARVVFFDSGSGVYLDFNQYHPNGKLKIFMKKYGEGPMEVYDSLGNRMLDLYMENGQVKDTLKVY